MKSVAASIAAAPHRAGDFVALTKPRLNSLVVVSAGVGYVLGAGAAPDLGVALHALIGCGLVAGSAAAFNQVAERDVDKAMRRTERRPLAVGRVTPTEGTVFAGLVGAAGLTELALGANVLAALVALVTLVCYAGIYTPLKRRTEWATLVGAVPGALPPVIGWAAARGALTVEAAVLFGIVFLWQLPHFHALAWLYRDDYARARLPLVATGDPDGRRTAAHAAAYAAALVPMSLAPAAVGLVGPGHLAVAVPLGALLLIPALRFRRKRDDRRARALFVASLAYLPLLWISLVLGNVRG